MSETTLDRNHITPTIPAKSFALSGKAYFTLESKRTSAFYAFKVSKHKDKDLWFVKVLASPGALSRDYYMVGIITENGEFRYTSKSPFPVADERVLAFGYFWKHACTGKLPEVLGFYHMGRCAKCARALTDPESIARGLGPVCAAHGE